MNRFGNPKLVKEDGLSIDFIPLNNIDYIKMKGLNPSLESFYEGVPLTVQTLMYDVVNKKVVGDAGIEAIQNQTVSVHNLEWLEYAAAKGDKTPEEYLRAKARALGFRAII